MDLSTFIIANFCLIDDHTKGKRIRQRGPAPKLSDAEVLTIEVVGEFLGIDTDKDIYLFFCRHYSEWFPTLEAVHRTTFARQSANLWKVKEYVSGSNSSLSVPAIRPSRSLIRCLCQPPTPPSKETPILKGAPCSVGSATG